MFSVHWTAPEVCKGVEMFSLLRPETPLCKYRTGDTNVPHYDLKDWTKWGPREDGELEGDAELETAEVQCIHLYALFRLLF